MSFKINNSFFICIVFVSLTLFCCNTQTTENIQRKGCKPEIEPDYSEVTIPPNIAPMNFFINEDRKRFKIVATDPFERIKIQILSGTGIIRFPEKPWKKLVAFSRGDKIKIKVCSLDEKNSILEEYDPIYMHVSNEVIDPYLIYRLIYPGYYTWSKIKIVQRSNESFNEGSIIENQILENSCINCHAFRQNDPENFLIHMRGQRDGTYFIDGGNITRSNLKIESNPNGAAYPSWHPDGKLIAFSSNQVRQSFYAQPGKSIEVYDQSSALILFDKETNEIKKITESDTILYFDTFPAWSPDGKYLYFCRTNRDSSISNPTTNDINGTFYSLVRKPFYKESKSFGETEIVIDAEERKISISFPRISPDGKYLVFTLHDYGTFPVWHKEADLYILNLQTGDYREMNINSDESESYHSWSANGKWLVFSSKRTDGRCSRPYFAYVNSWDSIGKPFVLPQKDPDRYKKMPESFNIPEFSKAKINLRPRDFEVASKQVPVQAKNNRNYDSQSVCIDNKLITTKQDSIRAIH